MRLEFIKVFVTLAISIPFCKYANTIATEEQKNVACVMMFTSMCYLGIQEIYEYYKKCKANESNRNNHE